MGNLYIEIPSNPLLVIVELDNKVISRITHIRLEFTGILLLRDKELDYYFIYISKDDE